MWPNDTLTGNRDLNVSFAGEKFGYRHPCNQTFQCQDDLICSSDLVSLVCSFAFEGFPDPNEVAIQALETGSVVGTIISVLCCIGCICGGICYCVSKQANRSTNNVPIAVPLESTSAKPAPAAYSTVSTVPPAPGYQAAPVLTPAYYPPAQPQYVAPVQPQAAPLVQPQYAPQPGFVQPAAYPQPSYQPAPYGTQPPPVQPAYVQQPPPMEVKPTNSDFNCPPPPAAAEGHQPYQPKPTQPTL